MSFEVAPQVPIEWILEACAIVTGVSVRRMRNRRKFRRLVNARSFAARKAQAEGYSTTEIGKALGGRDHSTVVHLLKRGRK